MNRSEKNRASCRKARLLTAYRSAWQLEHEILTQFLAGGFSVTELSAHNGLGQQDIFSILNRSYRIFLLLADSGSEAVLSPYVKAGVAPAEQQIPELGNSASYSEVRSRNLHSLGLQLSSRLATTLRNLEVFTVGDLIEISLSEMPKFRGMGPHTMRELIRFIQSAQLERYFHDFAAIRKKYPEY